VVVTWVAVAVGCGVIVAVGGSGVASGCVNAGTTLGCAVMVGDTTTAVADIAVVVAVTESGVLTCNLSLTGDRRPETGDG
jgi:hypothetical protein